ncbi:MAG: pyridoxal-dependent decarboxylase [Actinomycetota bacterium]|nr:pyridoxal-dependent decarboxylase [Actinomycetota bacterium]
MLRDEGPAALEWAVSYLERVGGLPVLPQVEPGAICGALPSAAPDEPEPFSAVLADLEEILLPGVTHWQHPRFFGYFATSSSEPAILAELLAATLNSVVILWRTAPAATELEGVVLDWTSQLLGLPAGRHGHIEDSASTSTLAAIIAVRHVTGRGRRRHPRHHGHDVGRSGQRRRRRVCRRRSLASRRRRLRRPGDGLPRAPVGVRRGRSRRLGRGQRPQVDAHADGLLASVDEPARRLPRCLRLVPEYLRTPDAEDALSLSEYGPALGRRFRALKLWAVLRCHGRSGLQAHVCSGVRLAELFEGWVAAEPCWELCAPRPFSVVCFRLEGPDERNRELLERVNASREMFISHAVLTGATCSGSRSAR